MKLFKKENPIILKVCQELGVTPKELKGRRRFNKIVSARQVAMYLLWNANGYTLKKVGELLGNRTPATVSHGYQKVARLIQEDEFFKSWIEGVKGE